MKTLILRVNVCIFEICTLHSCATAIKPTYNQIMPFIRYGQFGGEPTTQEKIEMALKQQSIPVRPCMREGRIACFVEDLKN